MAMRVETIASLALIRIKRDGISIELYMSTTLVLVVTRTLRNHHEYC